MREISNASPSDRSLSIALFALTLSVYLLASPAHFLTTPDEELNIRTTLSLAQGYRGAIPPLPGGFASKRGIDGREYAQYGLGLPLASAPWLMLGWLIDPSADISPNDLQNVSVETSAGTNFLRGWMTVFTMILTALTVVLFDLLLKALGFQPAQSLFFALLYAFGTYTWPHGRTYFTEPLVAFCLMGSIACFVEVRRRAFDMRWVFYAGALWAYAVLARLDSLVTLPAAAWLLCIDTEGDEFKLQIEPKRIIAFALPFVFVFIVIALYNQYRFDSFVSTGYEDQAEKINFVTPLLVGLHGFLFSPGRSIFVYSPPLIFLFVGLARLYRMDRWFCGGVALLCGLFLCVMSKWQNWAGGYDWGPRHIYQLTPFFMLLAACAFQGRTLFDTKAKQIVWAALYAVSVFVQFLGLAADPVLVLKDLLSSWPKTEIAPGFTFSAVLMQFTVYLPHFSGPVLHWNFIGEHGVDWVAVTLLPSKPLLWGVYLVLAGIVIGSGWVLFNRVRRVKIQ